MSNPDILSEISSESDSKIERGSCEFLGLYKCNDRVHVWTNIKKYLKIHISFVVCDLRRQLDIMCPLPGKC